MANKAYYYVMKTAQNFALNGNGRRIFMPFVSFRDFEESPTSCNCGVGRASKPYSTDSDDGTYFGRLLISGLTTLRDAALRLPDVRGSDSEYEYVSEILRCLSKNRQLVKGNTAITNSDLLTLWEILSVIYFADDVTTFTDLHNLFSSAKALQQVVNAMNVLYRLRGELTGRTLQLSHLNKLANDDLYCIASGLDNGGLETLERVYRGGGYIYLLFTTPAILDQTALLTLVNKSGACPRGMSNVLSYCQYLADDMSREQVRNGAAGKIGCNPDEVAVLDTYAVDTGDMCSGTPSTAPITFERLI